MVETVPDSLTFFKHKLIVAEGKEVLCHVVDGGQEGPLTAMVIGDLKNVQVPLVRIHSRCMYGEVFGSLDCDCRSQLEQALEIILREGAGIFIYMEQEGRGCGLIKKAMAYELKDLERLDTVDAYQKLGLPIDNRTYVTAGRVLRELGHDRIRLLTNNPNKLAAVTAEGVEVERVPLRTKVTKHNEDYLRVKQNKLGHDLGLERNEAIH